MDYVSPMSLDSRSVDVALEKLRAHGAAMPPVAAIQADVTRYDGVHLHVEAPLAANVNDKGSAFGGSLTSVMTYAGWCLVNLQLQLQGLEAEVYVADSAVRYRKPLLDDLHAQASVVEGESWDTFFSTLVQRGRARIQLQAAVLLPDGGVAADLSGRYVAIAKG